MNDGLGVKVTSYDADVQCVPGAKYSDTAACSNLIGIMPASHNTHLFTKKKEDPVPKVVIPPGGLHMKSSMHSRIFAFFISRH